MLLYIHVPYCRRRCRYCAFFSTVANDGAVPEAYLRACLEELDDWGHRLPREARHVETIFLGGGTPSLLSPSQLGAILERAAARFAIAADAEISLEGNPDSLLLPGRLEGLRACGVNRLSMGAQSLDDTELATLGRLHGAADVTAAVEGARAAGFDNIGLDLMWGLPGQTPEGWISTLARAIALAPEHISAYALTVEEGTPFARMAEDGALPPLPDDEAARRMFLEGVELLACAGFAQYEISNFAREGFRCRHNMGYWLGRDYLGIGPSAVSTMRGRRWSDTDDIEVWACEARSGRCGRRPQELDATTRLRETVMLRLRTTDGLSWAEFARAAADAGMREEPGLATRGFVGALCSAGLAVTDHERLTLTTRGLLVSNAVIAEFFSRLDEAASVARAAAKETLTWGDDLE